MKLLKTTIAAVAAILGMTSCSSDEPTQKVQFGYNDNITLVTDMATNTTIDTEGAYYVMEFDYISGKAVIDISNLRLTTGGSPIKLRIENAPFGGDEETGAVEISVPNADSSIGGSTHHISNLRILQSWAYFAAINQQEAYYQISFVLDNQYKVVAVEKSSLLPGTTTITNAADGTVIKSDNKPFYYYALDRDKRTATLKVYYLNDTEHIYSELAFENLPVTIDEHGISISVEGNIEAKQLSNAATPFVAKAISVESRYNSATLVRILTDEYMVTASLSMISKPTGN